MVAVREGLFTETHLLGSRCRVCGTHHFPRHETCPYCSSDAVEPRDLSPRGTLWAWTAVTAPPPGYTGEVPYGFGVVELPEGIRVITRLTVADPTVLRFGQAMVMTTVAVHDDVMTYAFAPA